MAVTPTVKEATRTKEAALWKAYLDATRDADDDEIEAKAWAVLRDRLALIGVEVEGDGPAS